MSNNQHKIILQNLFTERNVANREAALVLSVNMEITEDCMYNFEYKNYDFVHVNCIYLYTLHMPRYNTVSIKYMSTRYSLWKIGFLIYI